MILFLKARIPNSPTLLSAISSNQLGGQSQNISSINLHFIVGGHCITSFSSLSLFSAAVGTIGVGHC
jgi:hypothetical protein